MVYGKMKNGNSAYVRMLKDMIQIIPLKTALIIFLNGAHAASYVLVMYTSQIFFDQITHILETDSLNQLIFFFVIFLLASIFAEMINGLSNFPIEFLPPEVIAAMHGRIQEKADHVEPILFERTDFLEMLDKAKRGVEGCVRSSLFVLYIVTFYVPYFILMAVYLRSMSPMLTMSLLFVFIPVIISQTARIKLAETVDEQTISARREADYYEKILCDRAFAKETRLLGTYHFFKSKWTEKNTQTNDIKMKAEIRHTKTDLVLRSITICGYLGILFLLVHELLSDQITVGIFAAVFGNIGIMYGLANEVFGGVMRNITRSAVYVKNYQAFIDLPDAAPKNPQTGCRDILFENVSFIYPNAAAPSLEQINLRIYEGETIAIVGENGAGKTTLVKLLLGIYEPSEGIILNSHKNTAVFQNFQHYKMSLKDNIMISNPDSDQKLTEVLRKAGLNPCEETLPIKENTILSVEFGGIDLSGGQWQKIAMARGLYKEHDLIVLDEPTAAIDPVEETRIFKNFAAISKGRTTIIVTHRLGAGKLADRILVLKQGHIDDIGTHEQLMRKNGYYAKLYHEQAKWYTS